MSTQDRQRLVSPYAEDNPHHQSYLGHLRPSYTLTSSEPKGLTEECLDRAGALASVLEGYAYENRTPVEHVRHAVAVLADLVYLAYGMLKIWPEAKEDAPHA